MSYIYLAIAVVAEVIATSALKASEEFTKLWPSLIVIVGYSVAFYLLSLCLKTIPLGVMYAIWSGLGVFLVLLQGNTRPTSHYWHIAHSYWRFCDSAFFQRRQQCRLIFSPRCALSCIFEVRYHPLHRFGLRVDDTHCHGLGIPVPCDR